MMYKFNGKSTSLSILVAVFISGCATAGHVTTGAVDINVSQNSAFVEHENMRSAVAIMINKSKGWDEMLRESRSLRDKLNNVNGQYDQLLEKYNDLQARFSFLSDDLANLKNHNEEQRPKKDAIAPSSQTAPVTSSQATPFAPKKPDTHKEKDEAAIVDSVIVKDKPFTHDSKHHKKLRIKNVPVPAVKYLSTQTVNTSAPKHKTEGKTTIMAPAIDCHDVASNGKLIINGDKTYIRSSPTLNKKSCVQKAKKGEVFEYVSKGKDWYKLKDGNYISAGGAVDLTIPQGDTKSEPVK